MGSAYTNETVTTAGFYFSPIGHISDTQANAEIPVSAGTASRFRVRLASAVARNLTFSVMKRSGATMTSAISCTINAGSTTCSGAGSDTFADGDFIVIRGVSAGGNQNNTYVGFSLLYSPQ